MVKKNKTRKNFFINILLLACFFVMLAFSAFNLGKVLAVVDNVVITNAVIKEKSSTTDASIISFDRNKLITEVTFHKVNDHVTFELTLKNNDSKKYTIKTISDNNSDSHIVYDYDKHENEEFKSGEEKKLIIKSTYTNEVTDINSREVKDDVEFTITFIDEDGKESEKVIPVNPQTNDKLIIYGALALISLAGLLITLKSRKVKNSLLVLLLMIPFATKAASLSYQFDFKTDIEYLDKMVVTVDRNGTKEQIIVPYGEKMSTPEIAAIPGYNFIGFYDGETEVDFDKNITEDTNIIAKYEAITYNISYDLKDGAVATANPTTYTVEDEFTLNSPSKQGYDFAGWTGTGLSDKTISVKINKGTTGDLSFTANYTAGTNTAYKVIHKYQNYNLTTYNDEEQSLTGVTGDTVYPQIRHKDGFIDPTVTGVTILADGSAKLEYTYQRDSYTYSFDSNVTSSKEAGTYLFETEITVSPKEVQGYAFSEWEDGSTSNPRTITLSSNTNVVPTYVPRDDTVYTVHHKYQNLNGGYDTEDVPGYGTTDQTIEAPRVARTGFKTPAAQNIKILADGSAEVTYTYDRETYTFAKDENTISETANGTYMYGTTITVTANTIPGYTFSKWEDESTNASRIIVLSSNISAVPSYTANTDTVYTVYHQYETVDGGYETETKVEHGTTGTSVEAPRYGKEGFKTPTAQNVLILGDGTAEATYTYDRETYTFSVGENVTSTKNDGTYRYGTEITVTANEVAGYTFNHWEDNSSTNPRTITLSSDTSVVATYTANSDTAYTVHHRYQTLNNTYDVEDVTEYGETGKTVEAPLKPKTGFVTPSAQNVTIAGDGSANITYTYNRETYAFSVTDRTYITSDSTANGTYMYGTTITVTANTRAGYTFKWNDDDTSYSKEFALTEATTLTPSYTANTDTAYTVYHYKQQINGGYVLVSEDTDHLTGTTDANVTPATKLYAGFTAPSTQTDSINGDGSTEFSYYYTRNKYNLTITDANYVQDGSTLAGEYYYEEQITLTALEKTGYTFTGWTNGETTNPLTITIGTEDISIGPDYEINYYNFVVDLTNANSTMPSDSYPYGTVITVSPLEIPGYTFTEWEDSSTSSARIIVLSGDITVVATYEPNTNTKYTVHHSYQQLDGTYNTVDVTETGTTDTTVTAPLRSETGYVDPATEQVTILGDGSAEVTYTYDRETYAFSVTDRTYITAGSTANDTYMYGTQISVTASERAGYAFEWNDGDTAYTKEFTLTEAVTLTPSYTANDDTEYTVHHSYQQLDGTYNTVDVTEIGTTDTTVTAPLRSQTGFVDPTTEQVTILGDGSAEVTYTYDRETYAFSVTDRTYITAGSTANGTYMYGTQISVTASERAGYTFEWNDGDTAYTKEFTLTEAVTLTPSYTANDDTEYTVHHSYQQLDGTYNTVDVTETGITDTTVTAPLRSETGYVDPTTEQVTILGDGSAEVTYTYNRETYTFAIGDHVTSTLAPGTYMYGTSITVTADTRQGYTFTEWENGVTTASRVIVLTSDITAVATYSNNTDTPYTINHYKQQLDGTYPSVADDTDSLTGTTEASVTPATNTYTGFTSPATQTKQIMGDGTTTFTYNYTRNKYNLILTNTDYIQEGDISDEYYYEEEIELHALPKTGYTFAGWSDGENIIENSTTITISMGTEDVTVGPTYTINSYTITFETQGGTPQPSARVITYNNQVGALPDNVEKEGFTFAGWYDDPDGGTLITASTLVIDDDTYYAHWDEIIIPSIICKKAVSLNTETCNSESGKGCRAAGYAVGATITYGNIIRSDTYAPGDAFDCNVDGTGYNQRFYYIRTLDNKAVLINNLNYLERTETNQTGQADQDDYAGTYSVAHDNLPKTSEWTNLPITFDNRTARLISKDDIITMTNAQSVSSLSPTGSLDNYNFLFENSNYSGIHQRSAQWVEQESDTERYRYRNDQRNFIALKQTELNTSQNTVRPVIEVPLAAIEDAYVVKFDAMGGTLSNEYVRVIKTESLGTLPTPQHTGWVLLGWFDSNQFTTQISGSHVPVGYETYYAKYVKSIEFAELTYDEYELEVNETDTITFEDPTDLEPVTFTSSDPTVVTVDASGNITGQSSGTATITITGTVTGVTRTVPVTVYEVSNYYHIIFDVDGGEPVPEMDVLKDTAIGPLPTTTKTDYRFMGWFTNTSYDTQVTAETIITKSMTLHAKWVPSDAVAELNGNLYYTTLQAAIDAAPTTKSTIKLLSNVQVTTPIDMVNNNNTDKDIVLDLDGYTLSTASGAAAKTNVIKTKAHLEVKNGTISSAKNDALIDVEGTNSQLILRENITLISTGGRACVYNTGGNVLIDGNASLTSNAEWTSGQKRGTVQTLNNGTTVIKSGTIINNRSSNSYGVYIQQGTVTIGTKDGIYDTENLIIQGETNGICAEVNYSLYDGLVKGKTAAVNDETKIANTEDDMNKINDEVDGYKRLYYESAISKYKVTIEAYGGTGNPEFITIDAGDPVTSSDIVTPTKGVYTFGGWYYDDEFQNPVTFPFTPSGNMTIYAEWSYDASDVPVLFDMTSDAISDYYDNIDTWKTQVSVSGSKSKPDASDYTEVLDITDFKASMRTNFDEHNCSYCKSNSTATEWNENTNNCNYSSPGEFCEKSKGYNTGVTDGVNVYEYNTSTQEATLVTYTTSNDGIIYNMIPGKTYKWVDPDDSNVYGYVTASAVNNKRTINSSVRNVRDLGGMEVSFTRGDTTKTGTIKYGKLFRGAQLSGGQIDVNSITKLGVTREVDLRVYTEGTNPVRFPKHDKCEGVGACTTLTTDQDIIMENYLIYPNYNDGANYDALRDAMVYVMQKVVAGENIYFHCTIGTDRTGTLAYFLEGLLGVGEEEKLEDYELSYFFGLLNRHRYHDNLAGSQINPRFLSMYKTYDTNEKIYNWFMLGSNDTESNHPDKDLIEAFRDAMIDYD